MVKVNYQIEMEKKLNMLERTGRTPSLLLHSCCAPCSSYVLECLTEHFRVTVFYYNPNIYPREEFEKRLNEQKRLISLVEYKNPVKLIVPEYDEQEFYAAAAGFESEREGRARCTQCFRLRLGRTAREAKTRGFDMFSTTLTVSPHKKAQVINAIGLDIAQKSGVEFLVSDFKKKNGYKRSIELSAKYGLYRQSWCGCRFAMGHLGETAENKLFKSKFSKKD